MAQYTDISLPTDRFLSGAMNVLHGAFLGASRAESKRHFARIQGGSVLELGALPLSDGSQLQFKVALDQQYFQGKLSFTTFRRSLSVLIGRIVERIRLKKDMPTYSSEDGSVLFNIPALLSFEGKQNVFMLGMDAPGEGEVTLRLQFLDPEQFRRPAPSAESQPSEQA